MTKLNTILTGLVAAVGFSAAAYAQEATLFDTQAYMSTKSRAEVRAEAMGTVHSGEVTRFDHVALDGPGKTRAQVRAEVLEARRLGVLQGGEVSQFATPEQLEQTRIAGLRAVSDAPLARMN